jgi:hypothetical protein
MLLIVSILLGLIIASNLQIPQKKEHFAISEDGKTIMDAMVPVPPWNRTEEQAREQNTQWGWVNFNMSLNNQGKTGYEADGIILPYYLNETPTVAMRVVNETGFGLVTFDQFSVQSWNASKIYAVAYLNATHRTDSFWFIDLDNSSKYCFFFRGLENGTNDSHILISIKESWYEATNLIPSTPVNIAIVGTTAVIGLSSTVIGLRQPKKHHIRKRSTRIQRVIYCLFYSQDGNQSHRREAKLIPFQDFF